MSSRPVARSEYEIQNADSSTDRLTAERLVWVAFGLLVGALELLVEELEPLVEELEPLVEELEHSEEPYQAQHSHHRSPLEDRDSRSQDVALP